MCLIKIKKTTENAPIHYTTLISSNERYLSVYAYVEIKKKIKGCRNRHKNSKKIAYHQFFHRRVEVSELILRAEDEIRRLFQMVPVEYYFPCKEAGGGTKGNTRGGGPRETHTKALFLYTHIWCDRVLQGI